MTALTIVLSFCNDCKGKVHTCCLENPLVIFDIRSGSDVQQLDTEVCSPEWKGQSSQLARLISTDQPGTIKMIP